MVQIGKLKNEREVSRNFAGTTTGLCPGTVPGKRGHVVTLHKRGKASLMGKDLNVSSLPAAPVTAALWARVLFFSSGLYFAPPLMGEGRGGEISTSYLGCCLWILLALENSPCVSWALSMSCQTQGLMSGLVQMVSPLPSLGN